MINNRQSYRLRKQFDITWSVPQQVMEGEGIVFNISRSGMLFVTDKLFKPAHGLGMNFRAAQTPSFPLKGKLVWFRRVGKGEAQYQCGVQFLNEAVENPAWIKWMEDNILKLAVTEDTKILERILHGESDEAPT